MPGAGPVYPVYLIYQCEEDGETRPWRPGGPFVWIEPILTRPPVSLLAGDAPPDRVEIRYKEYRLRQITGANVLLSPGDLSQVARFLWERERIPRTDDPEPTVIERLLDAKRRAESRNR